MMRSQGSLCARRVTRRVHDQWACLTAKAELLVDRTGYGRLKVTGRIVGSIIGWLEAFPVGII